MPLTEQQQREAERLVPFVATIARSFGSDDELESEAIVAMCEAIPKWNPARCPLDQFVGVCVRNHLRRFLLRQANRKKRESVPRPLTSDPTRLYTLLSELPRSLRAVAHDRWVEGYTWKELQAKYLRSPAKLKAMIAKARGLLEQALEDEL